MTMTYEQFAAALRPLVERAGGAPSAAATYGVTRQTVTRWMRCAGNPPAPVTMHGAIELLRRPRRLLH